MSGTRLRWLVLLFAVGSVITLLDFWQPLLLATWVASLARPWQSRLTRRLRGSRRAAAALTVALVLVLIVPLALITASLTMAAISLIEAIIRSKGGHQALQAIVSAGRGGSTLSKLRLSDAIRLSERYGGRAVKVLERVLGVALQAFVGVFVFVYASYAFLADGPRIYAWFVERAPLARAQSDRLAGAVTDTGRGLLLSIGLTALVQAVVAAITYLVLGVPSAVVLGFLTGVASLFPAVGTGLVWVPVALGLALVHRWGAAIALVTTALVIIVGAIDHILRPVLSRIGRLGLPTFVVLLAIFGGITAFGPWGLLAGPLIVRVAQEVLEMAREERVWQRSDVNA